MKVFAILVLLVVILTVSEVFGDAPDNSTYEDDLSGSCPGPCSDDNDHCDDRDECMDDVDCDDPDDGCLGVCPRVCTKKD